MTLQRADYGVGLLVAAILVFGGLMSWQAYQQQQALGRMMSSMMGTSAGPVHGTDPLWYVFGTLLAAAAVAGTYVAMRDSIVSGASGRRGAAGVANVDGQGAQPGAGAAGTAVNPEEQPAARVLDLLPDDERRILEPVITSPGITQIELRDRSDFSKSKVSQTVSGLEKRGLLYRERQGRTYRVYPSDDLRAAQP